MRNVLRHIVSKTYKPLLEKYLSKTRIYQYENIILEIPPEVFHPGFFFSTRLLLKHVRRVSLDGKNFLEPGCGSGLISVYAAKQGARVTATDINDVALQYLTRNANKNEVSINLYASDVFENLPVQQFDVIAINPPYYKKDPLTKKDYAWHCGSNGEYFEKLFYRLNDFIHAGTKIFIVLFEGCDMPMIRKMAVVNGFDLSCLATHKNLLERNFIYSVDKTGN